MTTDAVETSTFPPTDDWDERTERYYAGEALEDPHAEPPLTPLERQREEYGGISVGAAFFGWLGALGVLALLVAGVVAVAVLVVGIDPAGLSVGTTTAVVAAVVGAVLLLVGVLAGSYAAGRLVRFDGGRQGVAVWVLLLVTGLVTAGTAVVVEAQYGVRGRSWAPEVTVAREDLLLWGGVAAGVATLLALGVAIGGGKLGVRYHAKVDRLGLHGDAAAPTVGA